MSSSGSYQSIESTAPSLEEAISRGLSQLGLSRNEVIIEIIEEGSQGVLGMGARDALIRLTPLRVPRGPISAPAPEPVPPQRIVEQSPPARSQVVTYYDDGDSAEESGRERAAVGGDQQELELAQSALMELLDQMEIESRIEVNRSEDDGPDGPWILDIRGRDLGLLIGRRGETLDALQYIIRLIISRDLQRRANIVVDVEGYKSRREDTLRNLARTKASQAKKAGRTLTLEPMPANERRIIHMTLREDNSVTTESTGTGDRRRVTITPVSH
jgi:spoIIIJ-associated protein